MVAPQQPHFDPERSQSVESTAGAAGHKPLRLEELLEESLKAIASGSSPEHVESLRAVARRYPGARLSLDPVMVELVRAVVPLENGLRL